MLPGMLYFYFLFFIFIFIFAQILILNYILVPEFLNFG